MSIYLMEYGRFQSAEEQRVYLRTIASVLDLDFDGIDDRHHLAKVRQGKVELSQFVLDRAQSLHPCGIIVRHLIRGFPLARHVHLRVESVKPMIVTARS
jgi:hypothetical protein